MVGFSYRVVRDNRTGISTHFEYDNRTPWTRSVEGSSTAVTVYPYRFGPYKVTRYVPLGDRRYQIIKTDNEPATRSVLGGRSYFAYLEVSTQGTYEGNFKDHALLSAEYVEL